MRGRSEDGDKGPCRVSYRSDGLLQNPFFHFSFLFREAASLFPIKNILITFWNSFIHADILFMQKAVLIEKSIMVFRFEAGILLSLTIKSL